MSKPAARLAQLGWLTIVWGLPWSHGAMTVGTLLVGVTVVWQGLVASRGPRPTDAFWRHAKWPLALVCWFVWTMASAGWSLDPARSWKMVSIEAALGMLVLSWWACPPSNLTGIRRAVGWSAVAACLLCVIQGGIQWYNDAPEVEWTPYTSHIRLSLLAGLGLGWAIVEKRRLLAWTLGIAWAAFAWCTGALTAAVLLPLTFLWGMWSTLPVRPRKWFAGSAVMGLVAAVGSLLIWLQPVPLPNELPERTPWGNLYVHQPELTLSEGGHRVFVLSCPMEWDSAWEQVSDVSLDTPQRGGHALRQCMLRYITSLGLPKDGATIASLSPEDVRAIERGNTNCHPAQGLTQRMRSVRFGYETWRDFKNPTGSSIWQRWEHWQAAVLTWQSAPWIGHGLGGLFEPMQQAYVQMNSKLHPDFRHGAHNQHLTVASQSGLVGLTLWVAFLVLMARHVFRNNQWPLHAWGFVVFFLSTCYEDTLETQAGLLVAALALGSTASLSTKDSPAGSDQG